MAAHAQSLTGPRKAAIFLASLGEEAASMIVRHLNETEVQAIFSELATLDSVPPELACEVLQEVANEEEGSAFTLDNNYAKQLLVRAFGPENGTQLSQKIPALNEKRAATLMALRSADTNLLATMLKEEHPQTIALILTQLEPEQSSAILTKLPSESATDVLKRIAQLQHYSPDLALTLSSVLQGKLQSFGERERQTYPGLKGAADIMNRTQATLATPLLEALESEQPNLAIGIRNLMFTFEDLITVPEVSLREWLSAIDKKTLALALKGASEEVANHIMKGMSSRASQMLKEDIEALGPTRAKEVAKAQEEAIAVARQLEAEGRLVLRPDGDDEYVV